MKPVEDPVAHRVLEEMQTMHQDAKGSRRRARKTNRAFTLVELAVVVTIVGVLAVIAVVSYRKFTLTAKVSEAQNMISAIRIAEEDYKTERGTYFDASGAGFCPTDGSIQQKTGWSMSGTCAPWANITVHVDGPVQFGYKVTAPPSALPNPTWINMTQAVVQSAIKPWYVVEAQADLNGDGLLKTEVVGMSFQNTIFSRNEGD